MKKPIARKPYDIVVTILLCLIFVAGIEFYNGPAQGRAIYVASAYSVFICIDIVLTLLHVVEKPKHYWAIIIFGILIICFMLLVLPALNN